MNELKVLDLFCGAGGASMGIHQALEEKGIKHEIHGYDIREMHDYPFNFHKGNALEVDCSDYDFIFAGPPCQAYSESTKALRNKGKKYPDLVSQTRELIKTHNYCIENVPYAPLNKTLELCGCMFNLGVWRKRIFETNFIIYQPKHTSHKGKIGDGIHFTVLSGRSHLIPGPFFKPGNYEDWKKAMGIDWIQMDWNDKKSRKSYYRPDGSLTLPSKHPLTEAIPPAYSKYIMLEFLKKRKGILDYV